MSEALILVGDGALEEANDPATIASASPLLVKPERGSVIWGSPELAVALGDLPADVLVSIGVGLIRSLGNLVVSSNMELCSLSVGDAKVDFVEGASNDMPVTDLSGDKEPAVGNGKYWRVSSLGLRGGADN